MNESANHTPKTPVERLEKLLRAVEFHRLLFLYFATANRRNPNAIHSRSGINERVFGDDTRGWAKMVDAIDPAGEFLWTHRRVLDDYALRAIGRFGPGEGAQPTTRDESGREIPVEGGTYPYWTLEDYCSPQLEQSSDVILEVCRALAEVASIEPLVNLVRDVSRAARPEHHDRWHPDVIVPWSYLSTLDSLIARVKTTRVEMALNPGTDAVGTSQPEAAKPDPQNVADLVVVFMVTRDLVSIGRDYPDAMPEAALQAWIDEMMAHADLILMQPGFEGIRGVMRSSPLLDLNVPGRLSALMSGTLMAHPSADVPVSTPAEIVACLQKAMLICQDTASPHIKEYLSRLAELMVVSCRCPTGTAVKDFSEPGRFLQLLHRYWTLVSTLVVTQAHGCVGFRPHPLLHVIENLRDRLRTCFGKLADVPGAEEAGEVCDMLAGMLTEGDFDDLSAVPEWTDGELQKVERFIARARLKVGARGFALTAPEEFFIKQCEKLVTEHGKSVQAEWNKRLARAKAQAPSPPHAFSHRTGADPNGKPTPLVVLGRAGDACTVKGTPKKALTDGQYKVVAALIEAGDEGLTKDALEAVRPSARRMLDDLRKDCDWASVILMPGQTNGRYRIRLN